MIRNFRRAALLAASPLAFAAAAHAQSASTTDVAPINTSPSDIVVTGTRGALESAEQFKRDSAVLVDGISADDIGALPDESIADSLIRIPGLTANGDESGPTEVSVRGLGPDLTNSTYNGRILPSTRADNRRLNLGDLPSEGIARAYVQKTASPSTIEGGLGGTIGMESVHPLETRRRGLSLVARALTDDVAQDIKGIYGFKPYGYRGEVSYIHRFADNLGVAFSYAHIQQTNDAPGVALTGYTPRLLTGNANGVPGDVDGDGHLELVPVNAGVSIDATNQRRDSILGMVQWRPTPALTASLDGYYINTSGKSHPINFNANGMPTVANQPTTYTVVDSVVTQYQGYTGLYRETIADQNNKTTQIQGGLNLKYDNGGPFAVSFDVSYAQAKVTGHNRSATVVSDAINAAQDAKGQVRPFGYDASNPRNLILDFGEQSADDYNLTEIDIGGPHRTDTAKAVRLDFHYSRPLGFLGSMDFGVRADNRVKANRSNGNAYTFGKPATHPDLDSSYLFSETNPLGKAVDYLGGPDAITFPLFDLDKLMPLIDDPNAVYNSQPVNDITSNSTITENTMAAYYQGNIEIGSKLTGNIGVRYFVTDETVQGFATKLVGQDLGPVTPLRIKHSYHYFLPSLNLRYAITRSLFARGALSETMSRPVFSDMRIGTNVDYTTLLPGASLNRGNPDLKPFTSKNADLDLEWYPSKSMTFAIQGYYKQVTNFIIDQAVSSTVLLPDGSVIPVTLNTHVNDPTKRNFYGLEVIVRRDFDFLPGFLKYFGIRADYSHNWTDARDLFQSTAANAGTCPVQAKDDCAGHQIELTPNNFSPWIANAQLYYSRRSIDFHLAYRYYARYSRQDSNGYQTQPGGAFDLTGSVVLARGIRAIGTIQNLTKAKVYRHFINYLYPDDSEGMARNMTYPGRSFTIGVRANF